ncbi:MAG: SiaB family protein kinase [Cytophagales bacterium]|nr:SiaB family protein kinase [Bernardetiaceae bacterium]MDW8210338.1 SiaB family protein kinase [Cytophagales bacterium]
MLDIKTLLQVQEPLQVIVDYKGEVSDNATERILSVAHKKLAEIEPQTGIRKRVFNILVELVQNVYHHHEVINSSGLQLQHEPFIKLFRYDGGYCLATGNVLTNSEVPFLKEKLEMINSMSDDKLKRFYLDTLANGIISEKGGAGLGLIEIARKSGRKFIYDFYPVNEEFSFFNLMITIPVTLSAA